MVTMPVPQAMAKKPPDKTVPYMVAGLMLLGLAGLILVGVIAGKKHLEF